MKHSFWQPKIVYIYKNGIWSDLLKEKMHTYVFRESKASTQFLPVSLLLDLLRDGLECIEHNRQFFTK